MVIRGSAGVGGGVFIRGSACVGGSVFIRGSACVVFIRGSAGVRGDVVIRGSAGVGGPLYLARCRRASPAAATVRFPDDYPVTRVSCRVPYQPRLPRQLPLPP